MLEILGRQLGAGKMASVAVSYSESSPGRRARVRTANAVGQAKERQDRKAQEGASKEWTSPSPHGPLEHPNSTRALTLFSSAMDGIVEAR
jgi:hypothetical protein